MTDSSIPTIFLNCFKQLLAKCSQTKHQELSNQIKNSINSLNDLIQNQSFDSFQVHLNPISVALKEDSNQFQTIILKCFFSIFNESKPDNYPRSQLTNFIIALTGTVNFDNDETTLLVAQICHTAMHSISGIHAKCNANTPTSWTFALAGLRPTRFTDQAYRDDHSLWTSRTLQEPVVGPSVPHHSNSTSVLA